MAGFGFSAEDLDMNNTIIPTRDQCGRVTDFTVTNTAPMTQSSSSINLRIQLPNCDYMLSSDAVITFCFYSETDESQTIVSSSEQVTPVQLLNILKNRMGAL
jgi:hypothetical protein